jgi:APA family basic amino acid/polyamine antiporter
MFVSEYCAMSPKKVFVREATGLVKEISTTSYALFAMSIGAMPFAYYVLASLWPLLGGSIVIGGLLGVIMIVVNMIIYWAFITIMPRSGGEYVFVSRTLSPFIGFVGNMAIQTLPVILVGVAMSTIQTASLSQLFGYLAVVNHDQNLLNLTVVITTLPWSFILPILEIILVGLVSLFSLRLFLKAQLIMFLLMMAGMISLIGVLVTLTPTSFASSFNNFVGSYTGNQSDYYQGIIASAAKDGWTVPDINSVNLSLLWLPLFGTIGYFSWQAQMAGELRNPRKTALYGSVGGVLFYFAFLLAAMGLLVNAVGWDFLSSINFLLYNNPGEYSLPAIPYADLLVAITTNPIVASFIIISGIFATFWNCCAIYLVYSRGLFAYSFDGILPKWFAEVSSRTHGPAHAVLTAIIISIVFNIIASIPLTATTFYTFITVYAWVGALLPTIPVAISAIFLYKLRPNLYAMSPLKREALTVLGVLDIILPAVTAYYALTVPTYGANSPFAIELCIGYIVIIALIFIVARIWRGPDLALVWKEIPPE